MIYPPYYESKKKISGPTLAKVGPFSNLGNVPVSGLPTLSYNSQSISTSRTNPLKFNQLTLQSGATISSGNYAVFLWGHILNFSHSSSINTSGQNGFNAESIPCCTDFLGGAGGSGGSGGGGGSSSSAGSSFAGGPPGDGTNGSEGSGDGQFGSGGVGYGRLYNSGSPFPYLFGGSNGNSVAPTEGGYGMAGDGGQAGGCGLPGAGGGGGGGAGMQIIVVDQILLSDNTSSAVSMGGSGGSIVQNAQGGIPAGGGVLMYFARAYPGGLNPNVAGGASGGCCEVGGVGNAIIYEIKKDNTLVLHTNWADSWNNL